MITYPMSFSIMSLTCDVQDGSQYKGLWDLLGIASPTEMVANRKSLTKAQHQKRRREAANAEVISLIYITPTQFTQFLLL
jgi:hypothetical protein